MWSAEAYGSDALTPLAWWGAQTERIRLGTGIVQLSARTPAATAMAAITLDHLSGGRFILGLGASGPQVVEGWYGQPYPKPLARTREYVDIVRRIVARDAPVEHHGEFYDLPAQPAGHGPRQGAEVDGPPAAHRRSRSTSPPRARRTSPWPPRSATAGCRCSSPPRRTRFYRECLQRGLRRPAATRPRPSASRSRRSATIVVGDDVEACADRVRPNLALYAGGMGARGANFHFEVFARMGYEDVATKVQELYLDGRKDEAAAAIPLAMVEDVALVGPIEKIREELPRWRDTCITTFLVSGPASRPVRLRRGDPRLTVPPGRITVC